MSKNGVIAALVVAVVLAVSAAIVLRPPSPQLTIRSALLPFPPSQVVGLSVRTVEGNEESITRRVEGGWALAAHDGGAWPIDRTTIDNALRLLSALSAEHEEDRAANDWEGWPGFEITLEGGDVWSVWCSVSEIGGNREVRVGPPDGAAFGARVEGDVLTALIESGVSAWRVKRALPEVSPDTTRIRLESGGQTIQLVRMSGRWRMLSPVAVAADRGAAEMLLRYLAAVEVDRFVTGEIDISTLGLDKPISVAVLEREIVSGPQGNQIRKQEQRRLTVGRAANVTATRLSAEVVRAIISLNGAIEEESSTIVEVSAPSLNRIVASPTHYISKRATEVSASNVGAITVRTLDATVRFEKTIDGWFQRAQEVEGGADGEGGEQPESTRVLLANERRIESLLRQLCDTDAKSVTIGPRADTQELFEIELGSLGGQPLESLTLSNTIGNEIVASKGDVHWVVSGDLTDVITWLLEVTDGN